MRKLKLFMAALALTGGVNVALAQTDVTSTYITNAGFDTESDFQTGDITTTSNGRKNVTGWSNSGSGSYNAGGAIAFGGTGKINGASIPSTSSNGEATGGALTINNGWSSSVFYTQDITLPAGNYAMTFAVNNVGKNENFEKDPVLFSFTTSAGASFSGNVHSYPVNTWTTQTITFALASEATGTIKIGYKCGNTGSGNTPKLVIDYVKALYNSNYTETLQSTIDRATILNTRASDSDLAAAITTAQGVLDGADNTVAYQATIDNAVTTLRTAISTAQAKVILLEGENITFMFENADFESSTPVTGGITTYDYDAASNGTSFSRMQVVEGWTIAENGNAKSAGVFKFGENPFLGSVGTQYQAPASASADGETKALGIVAVWSSTAQYKQACTLPAGSYILEIPVYNTAGTTAFTKNLIGFVEDGGTEHLATAKTYATGSWITEKVIFELENETSGYLSLGYAAANQGSGAMPHLFIDNVKVTYTSPIAAAYQKWSDAKVAAETAIANSDYDNVTGDERTALQAAIDATPEATKEAYNNAAAALDAAREAFTAAKSAYDSFVAAKATAIPELAYAATAKKTALEEAIAATATTAEDATTKAAAITTALRAYYESNAKAEGVEGAADYSSTIADANAETNSGWTNGVGTNQGQGYTDSEGNVAAKYLDGGWASNAACNVDMTRTVEVPAGTYLLTVKARGAVDLTEYTLSIAGLTINLPHANGGSNGVFGNGWEDASIEFESDGTAQMLEVIAKSTASQQWFSMNDFRLVQLKLNSDAYASTTADYADMNTTIANAEAKTLGFEVGEYAPYVNANALKALAEAKAMDQTAVNTNLKTTIASLVEAMNNWTANTDEVNAVNTALFTSGDVTGTGWTQTQTWGQVKEDVYSTSNGTFTYGEVAGFEMPLKANTVYKLTFNHRAWDGSNAENGGTVSVLCGEDGLAATSFDGQGTNTTPKTETFYFKTGAAGNYVFTLNAPSGRPTFGGVTILKAVAENITIFEDATTAPAASEYANVTLERGFNKGWNAVCLPFATPAFNDAEIAEFDSEEANGDAVTLKFKKVDAFEANKPYLVYFPAAVASGKMFEGVAVAPAEVKAEGTAFDFMGTYTVQNIDAGDYVVSGGELKKASATISLKPTRTYFTPKTTSNARIAGFTIDGNVVTGISTIFTDEANTTKGIYNLQGQKVNGKAQKGIYIVNGKKVIK